MAFDLRSALNAVSDVVNNRPKALREFDQIYMKSADMLLQTEHVSRHLHDKRVVFIGDGDAIALCLIHLRNLGQLEQGPQSVHVLDFDERVVNSIRRFAKEMKIERQVTAELYNVADPLPSKHWQAFNGFYTNPPFGQRNDARSVIAFLKRGFEAMSGSNCIGCAAIADDPNASWTQTALLKAQEFAIQNRYLVAEFLPEFHSYHLDDAPDLRSCSMILRCMDCTKSPFASAELPADHRSNFYGKNRHLEVRYVRDRSHSGEEFLQNYEFDRYAFDQFTFNV